MRVKNKQVILIFLLFFAYLGYKSLHQNDPGIAVEVQDHCKVEKVIDGDTIWCAFQDRSTKIRLLAVDAPETTMGKNECYGSEATEWLKNKILNKRVRLEFDKEEPTYGNYGRLLAYIWLEDTNINFELIKQGYAKALTRYPIHKYSKQEVIQLEKYAKSANLGLWGEYNRQ